MCRPGRSTSASSALAGTRRRRRRRSRRSRRTLRRPCRSCAPASDGGSSITSYTVTPYIGGTPQSATTTAVGSVGSHHRVGRQHVPAGAGDRADELHRLHVLGARLQRQRGGDGVVAVGGEHAAVGAGVRGRLQRPGGRADRPGVVGVRPLRVPGPVRGAVVQAGPLRPRRVREPEADAPSTSPTWVRSTRRTGTAARSTSRGGRVRASRTRRRRRRRRGTR